MPDIETLTALATTPISDEAPTGESVRYDDAFGAIEAEISKLENPAGGEVDWRAVVDGTTTLLRERSKDALLAAWLVRGCFEREGLPGLQAGLQFLNQLLVTFWDALHPERLRPRRAALEWLGERLAATLDPENGIDHDPGEIQACLDATEAIITWSDGRFDGEDCGLMSLRRVLRAQLERIQLTYGGGEVADAGGGDPDASAGGEASPAVAGASARPAGPAGPIANRAQAIGRIKELADWFAKNEPLSPIGPLLKRAESWGHLSFNEVYQQLLKRHTEAQDHIWDVLGIQQANEGEG